MGPRTRMSSFATTAAAAAAAALSADSSPTSQLSTFDFSFGVIGDTQYFDGEDGAQWGDASRVRRYRASLQKFQDAVQYFRDKRVRSADASAASANSAPPLPICVLLGDTIDGKCKQNNTTNSAFQSILDVLIRCNDGGPQWHFLVGNHDLHNFSRAELYALSPFVPVAQRATCSPQKLYYWCVARECVCRVMSCRVVSLILRGRGCVLCGAVSGTGFLVR